MNTTAFIASVQQECDWAVQNFADAYVYPQIQCFLETFEAIGASSINDFEDKAASSGVEVYVDIFANNGNMSYVNAALNGIISAANSNMLTISVGSLTVGATQAIVQPNAPTSTGPTTTSSSSAWEFWSTNVIIIIAVGGGAILLSIPLIFYFCTRTSRQRKSTFEIARGNIQLPTYNNGKFETDMNNNPLNQYIAKPNNHSSVTTLNPNISWQAHV